MKTSELDRIRQWFTSYVDTFAAKDGSMHNTYVIKKTHSLRVSADCRMLAEALGWTVGRVNAAEALGLLHDVGRFPQFQRFKTLEDSRSIDHGELGHEVVGHSDLLSGLGEDEASAILCGICCHNKRELATGAGREALALLKLIRDADKLDIFHIANVIIKTGGFKQYPEILLNVDVSGPPSADLMEEIASRRSGSYKHVRSLADMSLIRLSWVFDFNYLPTFHCVASRGLLTELMDLIPDTPETRKLMKMAKAHLTKKLKEHMGTLQKSRRVPSRGARRSRKHP